ncbi:MAG: hypothetical protein CUN55_17750, partial [Phototrophicales bacterium]
LMFDGFICEKNSRALELLKECSDYCFDKIGYRVEFINKPMSEPKYKLQNIRPIKTDSDAAEKFLELFGHDRAVVCKGTLYLFDDTTGLWSDDKLIVHRFLAKHAEQFNIVGRESGYGNMTTLQTKVRKYLKALVRVDDNWLERTSDSSLGYLLYNNGIYDIVNGKFIKGFDPHIVFHKRIHFDYEP